MKLINMYMESDVGYEHGVDLLFDKDTGEVVGAIISEYCADCDDYHVVEMLTNGSLYAEMAAKELGFREEESDDDEFDDDDDDFEFDNNLE